MSKESGAPLTRQETLQRIAALSSLIHRHKHAHTNPALPARGKHRTWRRAPGPGPSTDSVAVPIQGQQQPAPVLKWSGRRRVTSPAIHGHGRGRGRGDRRERGHGRGRGRGRGRGKSFGRGTLARRRRLQASRLVRMGDASFTTSRWKLRRQGVSVVRRASTARTPTLVRTAPHRVITIGHQNYVRHGTSLRLATTNASASDMAPVPSPKDSVQARLRARLGSAAIPRRLTVDGVRYERSRCGNALVMVRPSTASSSSSATTSTTAAATSRRWLRQRKGSPTSSGPGEKDPHDTGNSLQRRMTLRAQPCLFFTRFGRCKRGDACEYDHDRSKVAVCRAFLRGECLEGAACLLSHVVDQSKMPVCAYFLRGTCVREACPYSHVRVDPSADVCADFVRGYCSLGSKCTRKHTFNCPDWDASGSCPRGQSCRMRHRERQRRRPSARAPAPATTPTAKPASGITATPPTPAALGSEARIALLRKKSAHTVVKRARVRGQGMKRPQTSLKRLRREPRKGMEPRFLDQEGPSD